MPEKKRGNSQNTDNQETQYISYNQENQSFTPPEEPEGTTVFKPLKKVSHSNNEQNTGTYNSNPNPYYGNQPQSGYNNPNQNPNPYYGNQPQSAYNNPNPNPNPYYGNQPQSSYNNPNPNPYYYENQGNYSRQNVSEYESKPKPKPRPKNPNAQNQKPQKKKNAPAKKKKKKKHSLGCLGRIIRSLIIIFLVIFIIYSAISIFFIKKIDYIESPEREHYSAALSSGKVKNILLIGTDTRDSSEERGRSDSMILLSINSKTNKMYLTSIMRDSYVDINGYGWDKLTHAYSYGGPELLMDTIEKNFSIKIDDYIAINFNAFAAIIDAFDGIEIEISDDEAQEINTILQAEVNELMGDAINSDLLEKGGKLILNGKQALSYSRIRYVGNSDFERTQRQREVMTKIIEKAKSFKPSSIGGLLKSALPQLSTNMTTGELYILSLRLPFLFSYDIEQQRIPAEDTYYNTYTDDGGDALGIDFDENLDIIKNTIFAD